MNYFVCVVNCGIPGALYGPYECGRAEEILNEIAKDKCELTPEMLEELKHDQCLTLDDWAVYMVCSEEY